MKLSVVCAYVACYNSFAIVSVSVLGEVLLHWLFRMFLLEQQLVMPLLAPRRRRATPAIHNQLDSHHTVKLMANPIPDSLMGSHSPRWCSLACKCSLVCPCSRVCQCSRGCPCSRVCQCIRACQCRDSQVQFCVIFFLQLITSSIELVHVPANTTCM